MKLFFFSFVICITLFTSHRAHAITFAVPGLDTVFAAQRLVPSRGPIYFVTGTIHCNYIEFKIDEKRIERQLSCSLEIAGKIVSLPTNPDFKYRLLEKYTPKADQFKLDFTAYSFENHDGPELKVTFTTTD